MGKKNEQLVRGKKAQNLSAVIYHTLFSHNEEQFY